MTGEGNKPVRFSLGEFAELRLGYAATTHRAQGMTLERDAYVLLGGAMQNRELTYVQLSRARGDTHLFCDKETAGKGEEELIRRIKRSEEKFTAHAVERNLGWQRPEERLGLQLSP